MEAERERRAREERTLEADLAGVEPPRIVKAAALAQSLSSLLVGLGGLQLVGSRWTSSLADHVPSLLVALGLCGMLMAAGQYKARAWAGLGSAVLGSLVAVAVTAWLLYTLTSVVSCVLYLAVPLSCLSAVLSAVAVGGVRRTAAARERLAARGMNLGL